MIPIKTENLSKIYKKGLRKKVESLKKLNLEVKEGEIFAIEPFVTLPNAAGKVENGKEITIFRFHKRRKMKGIHAKKLLEFIEKNFL